MAKLWVRKCVPERQVNKTTMQHRISLRISVSENIYENWYEWHYGEKKDEKVTFRYINTKSGKVSEKTHLNFEGALRLACRMADDGRYKNFIFEISDFVG